MKGRVDWKAIYDFVSIAVVFVTGAAAVVLIALWGSVALRTDMETATAVIADVGFALIAIGVIGMIVGLIMLISRRHVEDCPQWTENGVDSQKQIEAELAAPVPSSDNLHCLRVVAHDLKGEA